MSGNVWEWCWDRYDADSYQSGDVTDFSGPASGATRVFRGGGWGVAAPLSRVAHRGHVAPELRNLLLGFRLARTLAG